MRLFHSLVVVVLLLCTATVVQAEYGYRSFSGKCTITWMRARFANGTEIPDSPLYPVCSEVSLDGRNYGVMCFAGETTVLVPAADQDRSTERLPMDRLREIAMSQLKLGEMVVVDIETYGDDIVYLLSEIVDLRHHDPHATGTYVRIQTEGSSENALLISSNHVLFRQHPSKEEPAFAKEIVKGDSLLVNGMPARVTSVDHGVRAGGVFAPETASGRMWVNRVQVSCYSQCKIETLARAYHTAKRSLWGPNQHTGAPTDVELWFARWFEYFTPAHYAVSL